MHGKTKAIIYSRPRIYNSFGKTIARSMVSY